jgi:hypothetical protein
MPTSMSPIRGDVKEKFLPFLSDGDGCGLHAAHLSSGEAVGLPRIPDRPSETAVSTRRFHDAMVVRRLRFRKLRKQARWLWWANHGPI